MSTGSVMTPSSQLTLVARRATALLGKSADATSVKLNDVERGLTWAETYTTRLVQLGRAGAVVEESALQASELLVQGLVQIEPCLHMTEVDLFNGLVGAKEEGSDQALAGMHRMRDLRRRCLVVIERLQLALRDAYALYISKRGAA